MCFARNDGFARFEKDGGGSLTSKNVMVAARAAGRWVVKVSLGVVGLPTRLDKFFGSKSVDAL